MSLIFLLITGRRTLGHAMGQHFSAGVDSYVTPRFCLAANQVAAILFLYHSTSLINDIIIIIFNQV